VNKTEAASAAAAATGAQDYIFFFSKHIEGDNSSLFSSSSVQYAYYFISYSCCEVGI